MEMKQLRIMVRAVASLLLLLPAYSQCLCPVPCFNSSGIDVRLSVVPSLFSEDGNIGRVEVCCESEWGTIALEDENHFWSEKNIQVACVQLGFSGGLNSILPIHIPTTERPPSSFPIHYQKVACNGSEDEVSGCAKGKGFQTSHATDVYIVCRPRTHDFSSVHRAGPRSGDMRLFGSHVNGEGGVEIFAGSEWATVCPDSSWSNSDARQLCTVLGYDTGNTKLFSNSLNYAPMLLDAQCSDPDPMTTPTKGISSRVSTKYCSFSSGPCQSSGEVAGIECSSIESSSMRSFRLFGLELFDDSDISGVVEVFEDQRWGMVCTNSSRKDDDHLARVICKTILSQEFPHAKIISIPTESLSLYESNMKPIWLDDITCPSDALGIIDCIFKEPLGYSDCSYRDILAVRCDVLPVSKSNPLIITGGIILAVLAVVIVLIFLLYLRRVITRRDRVSVTSVAFVNPSSPENTDVHSNGIAGLESQLDDTKSEETKSEETSCESCTTQDHGTIQLHCNA